MSTSATETWVRTRSSAPVAPASLSVVVPTFNERENVSRLFACLCSVLADREWEAIFVDDGSTDGTAEAVIALARTDRRARLITRYGRRGLASAVIEGILSSTAPVVAVIDADMQHDEAVLPHLVAAVEAGQCELAVGSRYVLGGSVGDWAPSRLLFSRLATFLAEVVTRVKLADPMSGFFAVRRDRVVAAAPFLSGMGYKVLLDLVASSPRGLHVAELPYRFRAREAGESKLDALVVLEYLQLLLEKTVGRYVSVRFLMFCAVGALGLLVHLAALGFGLHALHAPFFAAAIVATGAAIASNFFLNNLLTYRDRRLRGFAMVKGLGKFSLVCSFGAVANVGIANMLSGHQSWWLAGMAGALMSSLWNFSVGGAYAWSPRK